MVGPLSSITVVTALISVRLDDLQLVSSTLIATKSFWIFVGDSPGLTEHGDFKEVRLRIREELGKSDAMVM
jgi:hypothetical protein